MTRTIWTTRLLAAAALTAAVTAPASAGLLPTNVTITPEDGKYRWTYAIVLPTDMKLQSGNFFTIYDFDGYLPDAGNLAPEGWTLTSSKVGPTPDRLRPGDDEAITNLTWTYSGPSIPSGQLGLGNFWAYSQYGNQAADYYTARTNRTSDGLVDSNITDTSVPTGETTPPPPPPPPPPGPTVPEPGTLLLAGLGLPLLGLGRLKKKLVG